MMAETWWRCDSFYNDGLPQAFEVEKVTEKTVTYIDQYGRKNRSDKARSGCHWFPTERVAAEYTAGCRVSAVAAARGRLAYLEGRLEHFRKHYPDIPIPEEVR